MQNEITIIVKGGKVETVWVYGKIRIRVIDYDTDGIEKGRLVKTENGEEAICYEPGIFETHVKQEDSLIG